MMFNSLTSRASPIYMEGIRVTSIEADKDVYKRKYMFVFKFENGILIPFSMSDQLFDFEEPSRSVESYVLDKVNIIFRKEMIKIASDALNNGYIPSYFRDATEGREKTYSVDFKLETELLKDVPWNDLEWEGEEDDERTYPLEKSLKFKDSIDPNKLLYDAVESPIHRFKDILKEDK